jgi:hypothetical protein
MADRTWYPTPGRVGPNRADIEFSFVCNGASAPTTISLHNGAVASITYAATGKYTVTLSSRDTYGVVCYAGAEIEAASSPDGAYASIGNFSNEGTSSPLTFVVSTFNAGGTLTQYTNRRVWVALVARNSAVTQ